MKAYSWGLMSKNFGWWMPLLCLTIKLVKYHLLILAS